MKKIHALSLAAILLLAPIAPVSGDLPLASVVHAAAQQERAANSSSSTRPTPSAPTPPATSR